MRHVTEYWGISERYVQRLVDTNFPLNMFGYFNLSLDVICSSKLTVYLWLRSRRAVHFSEFSVFMWRHHIRKLKITFPSEVSVPSDKRPYRTLTFHNVLARHGSSFCNRARLNFQAFPLRDTKVATQESSFNFFFFFFFFKERKLSRRSKDDLSL